MKLEAQPIIPLTTTDLLFKEATVRGFWLAKSITRQPQERVGRGIGEVMHLLVNGEMHPGIEAEYELADFRDALLHAERPSRRGQVLPQGLV